jgi:hypothetical protein
MAELFVRPTRKFADVIVSGEEPIDAGVDRVLAAVRGQRV